MAAQLAAMRERDPAAKALIFTQFSSTLSWLGHRLQQQGYGYRTISGSMALKKRAKVNASAVNLSVSCAYVQVLARL